MASIIQEIKIQCIIPQVAASDHLDLRKASSVAAPVMEAFMVETHIKGCRPDNKHRRPYMFQTKTCKIYRDKQWPACTSKRFNPMTAMSKAMISPQISQT
jgi:hypothetical protein